MPGQLQYPVILPQRGLRMAATLLGCLPFIAFGVVMILLGAGELNTGGNLVGALFGLLAGVASAGTFGTFFVLGLILVARPRRLVLDRDGFSEQQRRGSAWHTIGTPLRWDEVTGFTITHFQGGKLGLIGKGIPMLTYGLTDVGRARLVHAARVRKPNREPRVPFRIYMRSVFGSPKKLLPLFVSTQQRFGTAQQGFDPTRQGFGPAQQGVNE